LSHPSIMFESLAEWLFPSCQRRFRCLDCGDQYEERYHLGCFGPVNLEAMHQVPGGFLPYMAEPMLCAHGVYATWDQPE